MFLQRVPNDVQPAGRQIVIERLGLQMEPFGRFEEAEMEPGLVDGGAAQKVKAKRGLAASRWPHGKRHRAKRKATSRQPVKIGAAAGDRSEERRVGKECVSRGRSWWSPSN